MTKTYIKTESREYKLTVGEVKKIILKHLQEDKMEFMGSVNTEFFIEKGGDVVITTTDSVERANK